MHEAVDDWQRAVEGPAETRDCVTFLLIGIESCLFPG